MGRRVHRGRAILAALHRLQEGFHRSVATLADPLHRGGERDHVVQRTPVGGGPPVLLAGPFDEAPRRGKPAPQDGERFQHRAVRDGLCSAEGVADGCHPAPFIRGEPVVPVERRGGWHRLSPGPSHQPPRCGGRQSCELRGQDGLDQPVALLGASEPPKRQHERIRRRLGQQGRPTFRWRGGTPASSSARSNPPTCGPCRRTTTARSDQDT